MSYAYANAFAGSFAMWWLYFDMGARRGARGRGAPRRQRRGRGGDDGQGGAPRRVEQDDLWVRTRGEDPKSVYS